MPTPVDEAGRARLVEAARAAMAMSYSPYSGFPVGAALLTEAGDVIVGTNVENASYSLTLCAERAAVARAVARGVRRFRAVAVASRGRPPASPCGACRQVLAEFSPGMEVLVAGVEGAYSRYLLTDLLPAAFGPESLHGA
jgi:cytidine deaminase